MFLHTYNPHPILFKVGPLTLYWYGLIMVLAIAAGIAVVRALAVRRKLSTADQVYDLAFWVTLAAIIGARLYAVALFWPEYARQPLEIFKTWHGGLAIHGAIIGGAVALWLFCRRKRQSFLAWGDMIVIALALGQAIGRWGNYFNQELFGPPTNLPWGIPIDPANRPEQFQQFTYFHPTFLYESLLNLTLFFILLLLYRRLHQPKTMANDHTRSQDQKPATGVTVAVYLVGYGAIRILMEQLRTDPTPTFLWLRLPIFVSLVLIIGGFSLFAVILKKPKSPLPLEISPPCGRGSERG